MDKRKKTTQIGGQAVLEGVMMRGKTAMATAVRDSDGIIRLETKRVKSASKRCKFLKLPIIRGCVSFVQSMFGGIKVLMRSAEVYGEGEPSKFEKWLSEKLKIDIINVVITFSLLLGVGLAIFLFVFLPIEARKLLETIIGGGFLFGVWAKNFIEGGFKLLIFVSYILLCSILKDIKRTFMYHGAEHKTITCYESGLPLNIENARKCRRVHDRCGTTFIVFVMLISILVFACFESILSSNGIVVERFIRIVSKLLLLPLVAGLSYELLKALSKTTCPVFYPLKVPGLLLQRITTREPDDKMLEVAIAAFKAVEEMDADETLLEQSFVIPEKLNALTERVYKELYDGGIEERAEAEWIVSLTLGVKRNELNNDKLISPKNVERVNNLLKERLSGRPLWYCVGDTEFLGYKIKVDERVLIPRPETELLAEEAIKVCTEKSFILDLCTGSGAVAVSVKLKTNALVSASDVSYDALTVATENAKNLGADVNFVKSDMFSSIEGKFDVIVSNPPYIKTEEISGLQKEVKDFEPVLALDGGKDGLDFYRIIANDASKYLNDGGVLLLECGETQSRDIVKMLTEFKTVSVIKDYEGIDRIIKAVL